MDVAPGVELYTANPSGWKELKETVVWMGQQGVDMINYSIGWGRYAPGDGSYAIGPNDHHPLKAVDKAVSRGILWVNSGGNNGQEYWTGRFSDIWGNGRFHDFAYRDEGNTLTLNPGDKLDLTIPSGFTSHGLGVGGTMRRSIVRG